MSSAGSPLPELVGGRYRVQAQLGRGGSTCVYHVVEVATGRELALKRLRDDLPPGRAAELTTHLEREFYALSQLRHPRVIEVYDYGVEDGLPYYTMELLDGGDLRAAAPLPFRQACELIYDVASSLALLHSRRFVHRDVTPANIRRTRDGRAKLIDFGAMTHMGPSTQAVGTPAYVAPEAQRRGVLDAGTDVFSLGATLYFALTGRPPFAALDLASMPSAWAVAPAPPSQAAPDIPASLDTLVLSMLSLEPSHRPRTAFDVMQRLAAVAGLPVSESASVSQGYLWSPQVVGREGTLRSVRGHLQRASLGNGSAVWIEAEPGVGRSRLLELCALEAKTLGACVLRLDASEGGAAYEGARRLLQTLVATLPDGAQAALPASTELHSLLEHGDAAAAGVRARPALHDALVRWVIALSAEHAIVIAVDDAHRLDEPSLAWLAALAPAASRSKLLLLLTAESERTSDAALDVLKRHSTVIRLLPLTRAESDAMLLSMFGAVPNLTLLSERIFGVAAGNPRRSLALAQYLVDTGDLSYAAGAWSLPEVLPAEALGVDLAALFRARLGQLGALARSLAETQALSLMPALRRADYQVLVPEVDPRRLDDALTELIARDVVRSDGTFYVLTEREAAAVVQARLDPRELAEHHRALARLAEQQRRHVYVIAYHELHAGQEQRALELLVGAAQTLVTDLSGLDPRSLSAMLERALEVCIALGRPKRERFELLRQLVQVSLMGEVEWYWRNAPALRAQLEEDSGLRLYSGSSLTDPMERLKLALTEAQARYAATAEHERAYRVDEAVLLLVAYVVCSIAIGLRTADVGLLRGLPGLLEPFVGLSPLLSAVWENVEATCDAAFRGRPERGIARWQRVSEQLEALADDPRVAPLRAAVTYGLGVAAASMGLSAAALASIEQLDREPLQRVNAMRGRRIVCLQHGDWAGAERAREQAELMALQASERQIFEAPLRPELHAHWLARDLAGVKQTAERIERVAAAHPGWEPLLQLARGYFEALRGDAGEALRAFEECLARTQPDEADPNRSRNVWVAAAAGALAMLNELGRRAEVCERGERLLAQCAGEGIEVLALPVQCELALAEASVSDAQRAIERIERVIADQRRRGVSGLQLAASFEVRVRVAIRQRNDADAVRYAALAAREYRHGQGSTLTSRYGRLLQEARRAGVRVPSPSAEIAASAIFADDEQPHGAELARALGRARGGERAQTALELLCKQGGTAGGHLYLARGPGAELECVASSLSPPSAALERFAYGVWQQQLEDAEMSAVLTELPWSGEIYRPRTFRAPSGDAYEAVVLYTPRSHPAHVGIAVLRVSGDLRSPPTWSPAWLSALAGQLAADAR